MPISHSCQHRYTGFLVSATLSLFDGRAPLSGWCQVGYVGPFRYWIGIWVWIRVLRGKKNFRTASRADSALGADAWLADPGGPGFTPSCFGREAAGFTLDSNVVRDLES